MRNQYEGKCYKCGETVKAGEGHFERHKGGWRVQHANCVWKEPEFVSFGEAASVDDGKPQNRQQP